MEIDQIKLERRQRDNFRKHGKDSKGGVCIKAHNLLQLEPFCTNASERPIGVSKPVRDCTVLALGVQEAIVKF